MSIEAVTDHQATLDRISSQRRIRGSWAVGLAMLLTDAVALQVCALLAAAALFCVGLIWPLGLTPAHYALAAKAALSVPVAYLFLGLYPGYGMCPVERLRERALVSAAIFGVLSTWAWLSGFDRLIVVLLTLTAMCSYLVPWLFEAALRAVLVNLGLWGRKVVILGANAHGQSIAERLLNHPEMGLIPVAIYDDDRVQWGRLFGRLTVEGPLEDAAARAREEGIAIAVHVIPGTPKKALAEFIADAPFEHVIVVPDLKDVPTAGVRAIDFQIAPGLMMSSRLKARHNRILKRALDYAITLPAMVAALPVILISAAWIKLADGGPVFYVHRRRGLHNRVIDVLKIRTMYRDADRRLETLLAEDPQAKAEWERHFKLKKDPRILPGIGHLLRKTSLDELPQLLNVLRGDMTIVGPRPFPDYHLAEFEDEDFKKLRASVVPGLTGYWQVSARSDGDLDVQMHLDTYYIRNWSIWLDFYILLRTILVVIRGTGAY